MMADAETGIAPNTGRFLAFAAIAAIAGAALLALAGCSTTSTERAPTAVALPSVPPSIAITAVDLQGDWGLASYRDVKDLERTQAEAKRACSNPYKVEGGPNGGAMMYLADQTTASEVFIKAAANGQVFIGPQGPPAIAQDRVVVSYTDNTVLVTDWLDPSARERYGTMIFVRCVAA